jgi:hypothetical protein
VASQAAEITRRLRAVAISRSPGGQDKQRDTATKDTLNIINKRLAMRSSLADHGNARLDVWVEFRNGNGCFLQLFSNARAAGLLNRLADRSEHQ